MTQFVELTDDQKQLSASGILPSGEGNYFDANAHSVNSRYNRGLGGGLSNENIFVEKMLDTTSSDTPPSDAEFRLQNNAKYDGKVITQGESHSTTPSGLLFNPTPKAGTDTIRPRGADDDARGLVSPTTFSRSDFLDSNGETEINFLSKYDTSINNTGFQLVNSYIHYMPNPQGGIGLIDKTPFYYGYNPLAGTPVSEKFYRYGDPS